MIRSRRRAHRSIHLLLWPGLAAFFTYSLAETASKPAPFDWTSVLVDRTTNTPNGADPRDAEPIWTREDAFGLWPARLAVHRDGRLELTPLRPLDRPELLLYWSPPIDSEGSASDERLPAEAILLGRIFAARAQSFALPDAVRGSTRRRGALVVYSLGHQEIVARAIWPSELALAGDDGEDDEERERGKHGERGGELEREATR